MSVSNLVWLDHKQTVSFREWIEHRKWSIKKIDCTIVQNNIDKIRKIKIRIKKYITIINEQKLHYNDMNNLKTLLLESNPNLQNWKDAKSTYDDSIPTEILINIYQKAQEFREKLFQSKEYQILSWLLIENDLFDEIKIIDELNELLIK